MKEFKNKIKNLSPFNQYFVEFDINIKKYKLYQYIYFLGMDNYTQKEYNNSILFIAYVNNIRPIEYNKYAFIIQDNKDFEYIIYLTDNNFNYKDNNKELHNAIKYFTEQDIKIMNNSNINKRK